MNQLPPQEQPWQPGPQPQYYPQTQWGPQQPPPGQQWGQVPPYAQVPSYAQPQPANDNFWTRWLMMSLAIRLVIYIAVPLLLCGGCGLVFALASLHAH